jgi:Putative peptidoglycan binding domain
MIRRFGRSRFGLHGHHFRPRGRRLARFGRRRRWFRARRAAPMPSPLISWAQGCLAQLLGTEVPQDGLMGPETRQAIQQFQTQQQSPPTGILDNDTVSALQAACSGQQAAQDTAAQPPPSPPPPPHQPAPPTGAPAPPRQDGGGRHARQQTTELEEGELAPAGWALGEQNRGGKWIRRRGGIILFGA